MLCFHNRKPN